MGRLARELDGLPLAIELAAARSAVLSPSMLVARLDQRFEILKHASPSVPPRHKALRAAIDVSWNLLGEDGRSVLAQCSVFRDGFSLEAAEAIVDLSHVDGARSTLDVLQDLREKSLIQVQAAHSLAGEQRFGMVLSIRAYAEEKLAHEGLGRDVQARHARWFLALAERHSRAAEGLDAVTSHRTLALERENLSLVLRHGLERSTEDIETVLRVLVALEHHFLVEGLLVARLPTQTSALEVAACAHATGTEARAHAAIALFRTRDGRFEEAEAAAEAARAKAEASGDGWVVGLALARSAGLARTRGDVHLASRYSEDAAAAFHGAGADLHARLATLTSLGCLIDVGQLERARSVAEHALATDTSSDAFSSLTRPQFLLLQGSIELELGQLGSAMTALRAGLVLALARGDTWLASWLRGYAAFAARERGAMREALAELDEAVAGLAKIEPLNAHVLLAVAGATEADLDRVEAARERIDAAGRLLGASIDNDSRCVLDLCLGHLELAEARRARSGGDAADADRLETFARARLQAARDKGPPTAEHPDGTPPATARGYGARRMARSLERALSGTLLAVADAPPRVRLDAEGSWVEPPGGARVSCERRPVLRRLLLALARAHHETRGRPVPLRALLEAGWPGERIRADAAKNRLYMMVSRLRGLGLGESLRAEGDGYLLAPELEVELVATTSS